MYQYELKLFIHRGSVSSEIAIAVVQDLCIQLGTENCRFEVIDIVDNPEIAKREHIVAVPTLLKLSPAPAKRIVGGIQDARILRRELES